MSTLSWTLAGLGIFAFVISSVTILAIALGRWWTDRRMRRDLRMDDRWLAKHRES